MPSPTEVAALRIVQRSIDHVTEPALKEKLVAMLAGLKRRYQRREPMASKMAARRDTDLKKRKVRHE